MSQSKTFSYSFNDSILIFCLRTLPENNDQYDHFAQYKNIEFTFEFFGYDAISFVRNFVKFFFVFVVE